jgi:CRP/FNR family cyclic AMP-dependent transcriptional regulator
MADLTDEEVTRFLRTYEASQCIFSEGDAGNSMYVVQDGEVSICRTRGEGPVELAALRKGAFFGEMSLVDNSPRSACAFAGPEGASVLAIDGAHFVYLVSQQPAFALVVLQAVVNRLRSHITRQE